MTIMEGERLGKIQDPREWKGKEEEEDRDCDRGKVHGRGLVKRANDRGNLRLSIEKVVQKSEKKEEAEWNHDHDQRQP